MIIMAKVNQFQNFFFRIIGVGEYDFIQQVIIFGLFNNIKNKQRYVPKQPITIRGVAIYLPDNGHSQIIIADYNKALHPKVAFRYVEFLKPGNQQSA